MINISNIFDTPDRVTFDIDICDRLLSKKDTSIVFINLNLLELTINIEQIFIKNQEVNLPNLNMQRYLLKQ